MSVVDEYLAATRSALEPLADPDKAAPMAAYMKDVAPFLGVTTADRRRALRSAWKLMPQPDPGTVAEICDGLWAQPEREYQYAACDLLVRENRRLTSGFLHSTIEPLITAKPWWDTVDSLGTAAICPITMRAPETTDLMWRWLQSGDTWLIRAALQHQRGRKADTDFALLYAMCAPFTDEREFFIAKAIGWALRDATSWDRAGVQQFVSAHPELSSVARREAIRGLDRSALP